MSTRKPKPLEPSLLDLPSRQLQLITVEAKPSKASAKLRTWGADAVDLSRELPSAAKRRLH